MVAVVQSEDRLIEVAGRLPAAPHLLVELGKIIRHPLVCLDDVVVKIRQDPSMVARLIQIANSSVYARDEAVGSLEEAVVTIGFREVHRLVGAVAATQLQDQPLRLHGVEGSNLRENSLFVAVLMEELADAAEEDPCDCYTIGLLRSIGKLALEYVAHDFVHIPAFASSGETDLVQWERKYWGIDNCEAAGRILTHWRLPHETVLAIQHHYTPLGRHNPLIHLLALASAATSRCFYGLPGEHVYWSVTPENLTKAGVTERQLNRACSRAEKTFKRLHTATA